MFKRPIQYARAAAATILLSGCGGGGGGLSDPGLSNVAVETSSARSATITSDGGSVAATGSNGVVYTLTLPEGAVVRDTKITLYPISSLKSLPGGEKSVAGVHFEPSGLKLRASAALTMQLPASINPVNIVGVAYTGNGDSLHLDMASAQGSTVTMSVQHFSGKVLGGRRVGDLLVHAGASRTTEGFQMQMSAADFNARNANTDPSSDFRRILADWYHTVVEPEFQTAMRIGNAINEPFTIQNEFTVAASHTEYDAWLDAVLYAHIEAQAIANVQFQDPQPELNDSEAVAVNYLHHWYDLWNKQCENDSDHPIDGTFFSDPVEDAAWAMVAGSWAQEWHIPLQQNGLDEEALLNQLNVLPIIEEKPFTSGSAPGDQVNLRVKVGVKIPRTNALIRHDIPVKVKFSRGASVLQTVNTDNSGVANCLTAWPQGVNPLKIDILATVKRASGRDRPRISVFDVATKTAQGAGSLVIDPPFLDVEIGQTKTFTVFRIDSNGNQLPLDPNLLTWGFSPSNVVVGVPNGDSAAVTGVAPGTGAAAVTLAGTSLSATADVNVHQIITMRAPAFIGTCNSADVVAKVGGTGNPDVNFNVTGGMQKNKRPGSEPRETVVTVVSGGGDVTVEAVSVADPKAKKSVTLTGDSFVSAYGAPGLDSAFITRTGNTYSVSVNLPGPPIVEGWSGPINGGSFSATNPSTGDRLDATITSSGIDGTVTTRFATFNFHADKACAPP